MMTKWDYIGAVATGLMLLGLIYLFAVQVPAWKLDDKREIQCETLGGTYHDGECVEITGTIELPKGDV